MKSWNENWTHFTDKNECLLGQHSCQRGKARCLNTFGTFLCVCIKGKILFRDQPRWSYVCPAPQILWCPPSHLLPPKKLICLYSCVPSKLWPAPPVICNPRQKNWPAPPKFDLPPKNICTPVYPEPNPNPNLNPGGTEKSGGGANEWSTSTKRGVRRNSCQHKCGSYVHSHVIIDNWILLKGKLRLKRKRSTFINSKRESEFGRESR